jgi:hypothetical protein
VSGRFDLGGCAVPLTFLTDVLHTLRYFVSNHVPTGSAHSSGGDVCGAVGIEAHIHICSAGTGLACLESIANVWFLCSLSLCWRCGSGVLQLALVDLELESFRAVAVAVTVLAAAFLPFVCFGNYAPIEEVTQLFHRMFPFGRGLLHEYWAPNVWALAAAVDKVLQRVAMHPKQPFEITTGMLGD